MIFFVYIPYDKKTKKGECSMIHKWMKCLFAIICGLSLVGCGNTEEPIEKKDPFNFDSSVQTRARKEISAGNSYTNVDYYGSYSFGIEAETFIQIIRDRYKEVIQFTNSPFETLEFKPVSGGPEFSDRSINQTYLVNDRLLINFVVPTFNGIEWDETISNIQFFFPSEDKTATLLFKLITLSMIQETKSKEPAITVSGDYLASQTGYGETGDSYSLEKESKEISESLKEFFKTFFNLKNKDRISAYDFRRY